MCSDSPCSQLAPPVNASCIISSFREVDFLPCRFGVSTDSANPPCGVRVGQSVVLECDDDAAVLYRKGEPVGSENQSSFFIPFVQPDDEGVYGCRSSDDTLEQRNLTVNGEFWYSFSMHRRGEEAKAETPPPVFETCTILLYSIFLFCMRLYYMI